MAMAAIAARLRRPLRLAGAEATEALPLVGTSPLLRKVEAIISPPEAASTVSRDLERRFFRCLALSAPFDIMVDWSSSAMGGGGGLEGIIIWRGRLRWESPEAEERNERSVEP